MNSTSIDMANTSVRQIVTNSSPSGMDVYEQFGDIELILVAELDRRTISADELLRLEVGQVLTFLRPAGENIDLFAGDVLLGTAEILAVGEQLAVRVADIRDKSKRA